MTAHLPGGTVTLLFTDIEGSTRLLHEIGEQAYAQALAEHRSRLRAAFASHGGVEIDTQGDAFFYAFPDAREACAAALEGREALQPGPIRVRMGLHTGVPTVTGEGYVGAVVHKGARIAAAGHGGQVLLSRETRDVAGVEAEDLGEHRLKDFTEPVAIFQLGADRFPPLKTISNTNLPRPVSSFVGRKAEVDQLVDLVRSGARLLTLTGPGGTGKTRLAIEAGTELLPDHRHGVFWVELAPLRDPEVVLDAIAQTIGAKDGLADHIKDKEVLLLLDNFEQILDAAPDLSKLLSACANLHILVTSREVLRVEGEVEFSVPPLAETEAVSLFCARSGLAPDDTIARLCRRLDDLPLAVELAAARTRVLSPGQIIERLGTRLDLFKGGRDVDPRQATLRGTIEWSHDLLAEDERRTFARMSLFAGGCTIDAAQQIAGADIDALQSLVERSLIRHSGERFWMLETIREFAFERLAVTGEAAKLREAFARYFLAFVHSFGESNLRGYAKEDMDRIAEEHDNLRSALDLFEQAGDSQSAMSLGARLEAFWRDRGFLIEGWRRLQRALEMDGDPTPARASALEAAADLGLLFGGAKAALRYAEEAVALNRSWNDPRGLGGSLQVLGGVLRENGDFRRATASLDEAIRVFTDAGREADALWAMRSLAWTYEGIGEPARSLELREHIVRRARAIGDDALVAVTQAGMAMIALDEERLPDAFALLTESVRFWRSYADLNEIHSSLVRSAKVLAFAGRARAAAQLVAHAERLQEEAGYGEPFVLAYMKDTKTSLREQLDDATIALLAEQGRRMSTADAIDLALDALETG